MIINKVFEVIYIWFPLIIKGTITTIIVSGAALCIGVFFGIIFGVSNCNKLKHAPWSQLVNFYVLVIRGTPLYVQVLLMYYALPEVIGINLSAFGAGILALGCNSIAYVTEIIRCGVNTIPTGQWDAAYVLGYSRMKALMLIIMPQAIKNILPALINEIIALLKESSILAAIGLLEITRVAMNISAKTLDPMSVYLTIALVYLLLTTSIAMIARRTEKRLGIAHDEH